MIILPKGAVIVLQDEIKEGAILGVENKKPNTGELIFTSKELNHLQGKKIVFRENYGEGLTIGLIEYLYFRDLESSMFYIIE